MDYCHECGHAEVEHASGEIRRNRFCEFPDCDCSNFVPGGSHRQDSPMAKQAGEILWDRAKKQVAEADFVDNMDLDEDFWLDNCFEPSELEHCSLLGQEGVEPLPEDRQKHYDECKHCQLMVKDYISAKLSHEQLKEIANNNKG